MPDDIVQGLTAYLQELDRWRAVCHRHAGTASVADEPGGVWVTRRFESNSRILTHLEEAVRLLPPWREAAVGDRGTRVIQHRHVAEAGPRPAVHFDGQWEGRRVWVHARDDPSSATPGLELETFLWASDLPELPLRILATALRCHEFLLPFGIAHALSISPGADHGCHGVRDYLSRTTPPNLAAAKCI